MKKIDNIIRENIKKFLVKEGLLLLKEDGCPFSNYNEVDISDWYRIGEIDYDPYFSHDYIDIWSNPQNYHEYALMMHKKNGVGRCIGGLGNIPTYAYSHMKIYDEFKDTDASIPFLGERRTQEDTEAHDIFMSKLNIQDGKVVLQHNSNAKIMNGVISSGHEKQNYSKNNDFGWYSWATEKIGNDPSNGGDYTYYCLVNQDEIYDYQNDLKRYNNLRIAAKEEPYVAMYWQKSDSIAVVSWTTTPIAYIKDNTNGKVYDKNWNEIG